MYWKCTIVQTKQTLLTSHDKALLCARLCRKSKCLDNLFKTSPRTFSSSVGFFCTCMAKGPEKPWHSKSKFKTKNSTHKMLSYINSQRCGNMKDPGKQTFPVCCWLALYALECDAQSCAAHAVLSWESHEWRLGQLWKDSTEHLNYPNLSIF